MAHPGALSELVTPRLLLRAFEPADEDVLFRQWNDPDVRRYLFDDEPVSLDMVRQQLASSRDHFEALGCGFFTIRRLDEAQRVIGFAGLRRYGSDGAVELLYALLPEAWGRGFATEAARAVLDHGFRRCGLEEIHAGADPPNAASFAVLRRLAMPFLGELVVGGRPARYHRITRDQFQGRDREP